MSTSIQMSEIQTHTNQNVRNSLLKMQMSEIGAFENSNVRNPQTYKYQNTHV